MCLAQGHSIVTLALVESLLYTFASLYIMLMGLDVRKPVFGVLEQQRCRLACSFHADIFNYFLKIAD